MACPPLVPISIIPPVSQGVAPILWQNGSQITRLNIPLNPAWLIYDGSKTRWGDGSAQAPILLPNLQQVTSSSVQYVTGLNTSGQLVATSSVPSSQTAVTSTNLAGGTIGVVPYQSGVGLTSFTSVGTSGQILTSTGEGTPIWANPPAITTASNIAGGAAGEVVYQTGVSTTGFTAVGSANQLLQSNGTSAPSWISPSSLTVGNATNATNATTATNFSGSLSGDVTGTQSATAVVKVNGASIPTTKTIVGTNASGQIIDASSATLSNSTTGNAATASAAQASSTLAKTTAKAWVNFNGNIIGNGTPPTGSSLVATSGSNQITWNYTGAFTSGHVGVIYYFNIGGTNATLGGVNVSTTGAGVRITSYISANQVTATMLGGTATSNQTVNGNGLATGYAFVGYGIRSSYNVSSITKNGTGDYTVNFTTPLNDAFYTSVFGAIVQQGTLNTIFGEKGGVTTGPTNKTTTALQVSCFNAGGGVSDNAGLYVGIYGN
jgi:hypothetical protein